MDYIHMYMSGKERIQAIKLLSSATSQQGLPGGSKTGAVRVFPSSVTGLFRGQCRG